MTTNDVDSMYFAFKGQFSFNWSQNWNMNVENVFCMYFVFKGQFSFNWSRNWNMNAENVCCMYSHVWLEVRMREHKSARVFSFSSEKSKSCRVDNFERLGWSIPFDMKASVFKFEKFKSLKKEYSHMNKRSGSIKLALIFLRRILAELTRC